MQAPPGSLPPSLALFQRWLVDRHGGVVCVGEFKSMFFDEIYEKEPAYCVWVATLADPGPNFRDLQGYLTSMDAGVAALASPLLPDSDCSSEGEEEEEEEFQPATPPRRREQQPASERSASKRARVTEVEPSDADALEIPKYCLVCCDRPVKTIFAACGHMCVCTTCSLRCRACPLCRVPISEGDVIRVFAG